MSTSSASATSLRWIPWIVAVSTLGAFFALGLGGWPGEFVGAGGMFCEAFRSTWVKQPANTWSNLGFMAAGLWMTSQLDRLPTASSIGRNVFTGSRALPVLYAAAVVWLGPGSMLMHGSGRAWGATADVLSMLLYIFFPTAYAGVRCFGGGARAFLYSYGGLVVFLGVPYVFGWLPISGSAMYVVMIPLFVVFEAVGARRRPEVARQWRQLGVAGVCFFSALAIWRLSHTGAPLCDPHSWLQGHAIWHLLCAGATVAIYLFYVTEDDPDLAVA